MKKKIYPDITQVLRGQMFIICRRHREGILRDPHKAAVGSAQAVDHLPCLSCCRRGPFSHHHIHRRHSIPSWYAKKSKLKI